MNRRELLKSLVCLPFIPMVSLLAGEKDEGLTLDKVEHVKEHLSKVDIRYLRDPSYSVDYITFDEIDLMPAEAI